MSIRTDVFSQSMRGDDFIQRSGVQLVCGQQPFYAIGINSYFLQNLAAVRDSFHILEIFQETRELDLTTIRTWGFFDSPDSANPAVIQWAPGKFNESGIQAFDYVVAIAKEFNVRLIIPLVNNWEDLGGMNQYVQWYADRYPGEKMEEPKIPQQVITGTGRRSYRVYVTNTLTHDNFYSNPTIRQWYKDYISMIINRKNSFTNVVYRDEPTILAWELANEPRSSDSSGEIVARWIDEMSSFIKSIDPNHLVATGEEGLDISFQSYHPMHEYNEQEWLLDGSGGISFRRNISLPNIDIGSIHCYPDAWGLAYHQGIFWLKDHQRLADEAQKPLILGEVGVRRQPQLFFEAIFNEGLFNNTAGIIPWQFVYDGWLDNDGYAFSFPRDEEVCKVLKKYGSYFDMKRRNELSLPPTILLFQNYPNPFNQYTVISYTLSSTIPVRLEIFNQLGQNVHILIDEEQLPGTHVKLFDGSVLSSGSYFIRLISNNMIVVRKMILVK